MNLENVLQSQNHTKLPMPKQLSARKFEQKSFQDSKLEKRLPMHSLAGGQQGKHNKTHVSDLPDNREL